MSEVVANGTESITGADARAGAVTLVAAWTSLRRRFEAGGIATPIIDARLLVEGATGATRLDIITDPHRPLDDHAIRQLDDYATRREAFEPVAYILGRTEFFGLDLTVSPATLIPRADSETLVYAGLSLIKERIAPRILDLGTGSGALLLALLHARPDASGVGVDICPAALAVAQANARHHDLASRACFCIGDFGHDLAQGFDLVITNPPYIPRTEIATLAPDVRDHEPHQALDGGADGLDFYRRLAGNLPKLLTRNGHFIVEIGAGTANAVTDILEAGGEFSLFASWPDLSGHVRALAGRRHS